MALQASIGLFLQDLSLGLKTGLWKRSALLPDLLCVGR